MCRSGVKIGVFGHVALGMATRKFWDAASKDTGAEGRLTALRSETDPELVGLLIAFGGMLSPAWMAESHWWLVDVMGGSVKR